MDVETQEIRLARQRASVKWLLSKAFNNRVPDNLKEPFYRDHENQERLKPQIVVEMGNATLYCQTLSNLYSDPNYQSLNHWSILQTLARKGVPVAETANMPLTETVLLQTNPLRINAHMSVIESLMILYAKEISSGDRISSAVRRISGSNITQAPGQHFEQSLLTWISHVCASLKKRISQEVESGATDEHGVRLQAPDIPPIREFQDLCDGVCLALLISYYCPKVVPWTSVRVNYLPAVEDSIHNVLLVSNFSQKHLPYSVFHMTPEDVTYMRGSMKQNLVVLLADLFNLFEIHPAKCVCYPGMEAPVTRSASATVIMRRPTPTKEYQTVEHNNYQANDEGFVVHKTRGITTLSSMHSQQQQQQQQQQHQPQQQQQQQEPLVPARLRQAKEKNNMETKADERGDYVPAGRPSNWEQNRRPSFAGRRSRRNSSSEDSQLTIENFGGSQDQLNIIGRVYDRDRERERERERKLSSASIEPAVAVRSSIADARGTLQLGYDTDSGSEKQDRETEKYTMRRQGSVDNVSLRAMSANTTTIINNSTGGSNSNSNSNTTSSNSTTIKHSIEKDIADGDDTHHSPSQHQQNQQQLPQQQQSSEQHNNINNTKSSAYNVDEESTTPKRKTSFAALPGNTTTTTWQQQSALMSQSDQSDTYEEDTRPLVDATKLSTIRMKLEEKRRRIEQEKRKIEVALSRHQEKDDIESSSDSMKWETLSNESKSTPDIDPIDLDKYQQSIAIMNSNLQDIQQDIHRLATQQNQIQAQHLQAQQLIQAQQIANMLNQQPYGSQQHLPGQYQRPIQQQQQQQQGFGSTPHLPQSYNTPISAYNSRPPSRDPYQQLPATAHHHQHLQHQQQQQQQPIQYINEHGQYISQQPMMQQQQQQPQQPQSSPYSMQTPQNSQHSAMYSREGSQLFGYNENGAQPAVHQYSSHPYGGHPTLPHLQQQQQQQYPSEPPNQFQSHQYISRPPEYDDYPPPHRGRDPNSPQPSQFYLHESSPQPAQRRTWAQSAAAHEQQHHPSKYQQHHQPMVDVNAWQSQNLSPKVVDTRTTSWKMTAAAATSTPEQQSSNSGGFILHQNGGRNDYNHHEKSYQNLFPVHSSPQHQAPTRNLSMSNLRDIRSPVVMKSSQAPLSSVASPQQLQQQQQQQQQQPQPPQQDDMAPQSICFIGDEEDVDQIELNIIDSMQSAARLSDLNHHAMTRQQQIHQQQQMQHIGGDYENDISLSKLNITSGSLTYRIPSPSRPSLNANSFQDPQENQTNEKGFYISFDDDQPKRPKPPLRAKRSPKKEKSMDNVDNHLIMKRESLSQLHNNFSSNDSNELKHNHFENNKATYNKYTDAPIQLRQLTDSNHHQTINMNNASTIDRRHLEDVTNQQQQQQTQHQNYQSSPQQQQQQQQISSSRHLSSSEPKENNSKALIIGTELSHLDPDSVDEMERKKEKIMLLSLQRRQEQEEAKARKEIESNHRREREREKEEERARKKEEQVARRAAILEQHRLKKAIEEAEREGKTLDRSELLMNKHLPSQQSGAPRLRQQRNTRPRPKTIHVESGSVDISEASSLSSRGKKGSSTNLTGGGSGGGGGGYGQLSSNSMRRDYYRGSQDSLTVKEPTVERGRTMSRISVAKGSSLNFRGRKSNSLMNLCDSGLGRATPPRRAPSPGMMAPSSGRHMPSPSGPGSLPPGLVSKRRVFDDGSSDISSTPNSMMEYSGPKLYKQPAAKSNRGIILNAVEYCVFPGAVNRDAKQKVLEKIARSEAKHFLVLFRDAGCQFRALYSYVPETDQVYKLYGTGPSQVDEVMFDKFFKYNSGGKCFSQVHTKHLTVTIDAFTIHNSLWQGKKVQLPSKKDMALVI